MKYRHAHHAGNFADVHKHVALLALLAALKRKDRGFFYLETHAGRGLYERKGEEAQTGVERIVAVATQIKAPELKDYVHAVAAFRALHGPQAYPGSPLLAAETLRSQDRGVLIELQAEEARGLERALAGQSHSRVECGDGYARLRAHLPPIERRGLTLIDPPYEDTKQDFDRVRAAILEALRRFETGVVAAWYPIKQESAAASWRSSLAEALPREALACELWVYPRDSRVGLNGSGLVVVNPPYLLAERMQAWLPELHARLDPERLGGFNIQALSFGREH